MAGSLANCMFYTFLNPIIKPASPNSDYMYQSSLNTLEPKSRKPTKYGPF